MTNSADPDQKSTDLDLQCLLRQGMSCSARGLSMMRTLNFVSISCMDIGTKRLQSSTIYNVFIRSSHFTLHTISGSI